MRILLRADASPQGGVGHVMRLVALGEELVRRGHPVQLRASLGKLDWVRRQAERAGVPLAAAQHAELGETSGADVLVVDSYEIAASDISAAAHHVPVLAVIDGDARGIEATAYLDHNLGADELPWEPGVAARLLAGSRYALIRRAVREARDARADRVAGPRPQVLVVLGGTDAAGGIARVVASVALAVPDAEVTAVTATPGMLAAYPGVREVPPGDGLPALLAATDLVVTAAGASAWEVCTIGVPAVFAAVVPNQLPSTERIARHGLGPVVDATSDPGAFDEVGTHVAKLLGDPTAGSAAARRMTALFDGAGTERVARWLEGTR
jgi:spore coat polysaccharide biosynthesis predicted glycosyltransferase SpsG